MFIIKNVIISRFNFNYTINYNSKKVVVPVLGGLGLSNIKLKKEWMFNLLERIEFKEDEVFIDVGVNIGQTLIAFKSIHKTPYFGFEPNPNCLFYIRNLVERNNYNNVRVFPVGLSSETTFVKFFSESVVDSSATIVEGFRGDFYKNKAANYIPVFKFDAISEIKDIKIKLVKIDVEGAELEVIKGMVETLASKKPLLQCEILDYHEDSTGKITQHRANEFLEIMKSIGYQGYKVVYKSNKIEFRLVDKIELTLWTRASLNNNDYLFVHEDNSYEFKSIYLNV